MMDKMFLSHMDDLAETAQRQGVSHSKFLTLADLEQVRQRYSRRRDVTLLTDGGFENAERRVAVFLNPEWGEFKRETVISAIELAHRPQDTLSHRDVLGAALALGIEREILGDILIEPTRAVLICLSGITSFITENMKTAGRVGLTVSEIPLDSLPDLPENYERVSGTVASLRLDAVMAFAFRISRELAQEKIAAGQVQLSHQVCLQPAKTVSLNSVISLRGSGRVRLLEIGGLSQKGRQRIVIGKYI